MFFYFRERHFRDEKRIRHEYEKSLTITIDDGHSPVSMLALIDFILLEAVLYDLGAAIQNVDEGRLEDEAEEGSRKAACLLEIASRPGRFVHTIQITTHLIGVTVGAVIPPVQVNGLMRHVHVFKPLAWWKLGTAATPWYLDSVWWEQTLFMAMVTVILLLITISFSVIIPRHLAAKGSGKQNYRMFLIVLFTAEMFLPPTKLITLLSTLVLKLSGVEITNDDDNVTEGDIMSVVNEGREREILEADETEMIIDISEPGDKEASDIMTHRTNMTALGGTMPLKETVDFILNEGINARYLVYRGDIDDIIGILHTKDAMVCMERAEYKDKPLMRTPGPLREANFIPETRGIDTLSKEMQSGKIHMEVVVDEYGQTAGFLTMEGILEKIVGDTLDEYDGEKDFITTAEDSSYIMSGLTLLDDVMEVLDTEFLEEDSDTCGTLNEYLISRLDRIPQEGENPRMNFGRYTFEVMKAGSKTIESVLAFKRLSQERGDSEEEREDPRSDRLGKGLVGDKYERPDRKHEGDVS